MSFSLPKSQISVAYDVAICMYLFSNVNKFGMHESACLTSSCWPHPYMRTQRKQRYIVHRIIKFHEQFSLCSYLLCIEYRVVEKLYPREKCQMSREVGILRLRHCTILKNFINSLLCHDH